MTPQPRKKRWLRRLARLATLAAVIYAVWLGFLYTLQEKLIFPRDMAGPPMGDTAIPRGVERVWITAEDGSRVEAWYIRAPGASKERPAGAAVFFHGNAELIDHQLGLAERYVERGFSVLLCEFRGYGRSGGRPSQAAIVADAAAFYDGLAARPEVDRTRIVIHGRSLGTGAAAQLAAIRPAGAVILESPFTSLASLAWHYGAPPLLLKHPFRTDRVLPNLKCPILILHSHDDEIIPFSHGQRLHELAPASTFVELNGSHNSALSEQDEYWK